MKILLLEDNETLANGINKKLQEVGYIVDLFFNGEDGLYTLETVNYDLLILDLGLPLIDGIDIIKILRNSEKNLPILVISARDKLDQRILGLDTGADDYLCKPFELDEVVARVNALLRRSNNKSTNIIKYNDLVFDFQSLIVKKDDKIIDLSKRELRIFEYLILNLNAIISKENIAEQVTTVDDEFNPTAVETYISRLRKKLGDSINLKTVRGLGYMLS
ncbi:DNA-binding response regulator [Malaciobacter molluscorum LMG 25693]|uniref:DNA-binding response regulator n=1 Tax=Malaciobacter molluscorum LMG 25693 TaxID=870501 RepID=A0A2G1DLJ5_9BACT|nr:response regulator transcription factor [Malaciobacter molluscorum]AXX92156.1 two-component system response regulator [Malaciobacter molluscorum LMG 25693]PHO19385.1 DNA-binding response regulator [Malaciobacter molluscorum LMG 25693]RXJ96360.1 DNA-binding response regulator [Malaciobacter molluscorum]